MWPLKAIVFEINHWEKCFLTLIPSWSKRITCVIMENEGNSSNGNAKEVKIKGARGISLKACVAKAAGWSLEKANSATNQEATTNKTQWFKMAWLFLDMKSTTQVIHSFMKYMSSSKPSPEVGRLRVVGLASQGVFCVCRHHSLWILLDFGGT